MNWLMRTFFPKIDHWHTESQELIINRLYEIRGREAMEDELRAREVTEIESALEVR